MSTRGADFLHLWVDNNLPDFATDDPALISDLADDALRAAHGQGLSDGEIVEEVGSVFEVIYHAMHHRRGGLAH